MLHRRQNPTMRCAAPEWDVDVEEVPLQGVAIRLGRGTWSAQVERYSEVFGS